MHKFSLEEIETWRTRLEGHPETTARIENHEFKFFVLPQSNQPLLPNYALRVTGDRSDPYVLGVSDSIPESWRKYVAFHEYYEYLVIGMDTPGRCRMALEKELSVAPDPKEYIPMRARFFGDLIIYGLQNPKGFTPEDIEEFRHSRTFLEKRVKELFE